MAKRAKNDPTPPERWRDVPGYEGLYQVSTEGRVRRRMDKGGWRMVKIVSGRGYSGKSYVVNLRKDRHNTQIPVLRLVALTFCPERMKGDVVCLHRNGLHSDNSLWNLVIVSKHESGRRCNKVRRRPVMKIDQNGEPLEIYSSIAEACRVSGLAKKTIYRHCDNKPTLLLPWGVSYRWVDR